MCLSVQAQFYLKGYTGYSLSAGDKQMSYYQIVNGVMDGVSKDMNFGQGLNLGVSAGYSFNKNIALEITGNTQFFSGLKFSAKSDVGAPDENGNWNWRISGYWGENKITHHFVQFAPQLVFSSNPFGNWIFYLKGGPDLLYAQYTISSNSPGYKFFPDFPIPSRYVKRKYSGGIYVGTQFSAGAEYSLKENIRLFAEITAVSVRYNFKKYKILQNKIDGVDAMSDLESTSGEGDNKINFNNFGLNIGIKYIFGK
jgi:hypothetical protein